jgi:hypothetical protein
MLGGIKLPVPRRAQRPDSDDDNDDDSEDDKPSKKAPVVVQQAEPQVDVSAPPPLSPPVPPQMPPLGQAKIPPSEPPVSSVSKGAEIAVAEESEPIASAKVSSGLAARMAGLGGMPMMMPGMAHPSMKKEKVEDECPVDSEPASQGNEDLGNKYNREYLSF